MLKAVEIDRGWYKNTLHLIYGMVEQHNMNCHVENHSEFF